MVINVDLIHFESKIINTLHYKNRPLCFVLENSFGANSKGSYLKFEFCNTKQNTQKWAILKLLG